ncbi:unnamed protein product [Candidula unifasciata]|uniref:Uncharacterized protein n=1 Tax=Candidula unifasciata TaxID=100452 RepID=A0A8S3ZBB1_9EUPU|nr:unnamed protein product [Candidula unifasciata]
MCLPEIAGVCVDKCRYNKRFLILLLIQFHIHKLVNTWLHGPHQYHHKQNLILHFSVFHFFPSPSTTNIIIASSATFCSLIVVSFTSPSVPKSFVPDIYISVIVCC